MKDSTKKKVKTVAGISGTVMGSCAATVCGAGIIWLGRGALKPTLINKIIAGIGGFGVSLAMNHIVVKAVEEEVDELVDSAFECIDMIEELRNGTIKADVYSKDGAKIVNLDDIRKSSDCQNDTDTDEKENKDE